MFSPLVTLLVHTIYRLRSKTRSALRETRAPCAAVASREVSTERKAERKFTVGCVMTTFRVPTQIPGSPS